MNIYEKECKNIRELWGHHLRKDGVSEEFAFILFENEFTSRKSICDLYSIKVDETWDEFMWDFVTNSKDGKYVKNIVVPEWTRI